ncbi:MAG TPA: helix-turn-helix transcriptional regulator [Anaerovoracaceae bacterium]|nr:helix-turn-helix transcriptional regulator [Anaerovoracaceae bacterium]
MKTSQEIKALDAAEMGRRIRTRREEIGMTREELAAKLHVSYKFMGDIESGERGVSIKKLYTLAQILNLTTDYILAGKGESPEEIEERKKLEENILEPLGRCNKEQLRCMEKIVKYYVLGLDKEE